MGIRSDLPENVKAILEAQFPAPSKVTVRDDDGIIAIVVSDQFGGLEDLDRQGLAWRELETNLDRPEQREIAIIVTVTPEEEIAYSA